MIGEKIRAARKEKHMSTAELAEKAGCSRVTIIQVENGKTKHMNCKTAVAVADALELPLDFLLRD